MYELKDYLNAINYNKTPLMDSEDEDCELIGDCKNQIKHSTNISDLFEDTDDESEVSEDESEDDGIANKVSEMMKAREG